MIDEIKVYKINADLMLTSNICKSLFLHTKLGR